VRGPFLCVVAWPLGFWRGGGGGFFYSDGVGPFSDIGVSFFHRHPGILHKHLRAFAPSPGEIAEEVLSADAVCAGWGIDSCLAALDHAGQIVHSILRFRDHSMPDGLADYQSAELDASLPFR
jgi:hypothetical protein